MPPVTHVNYLAVLVAGVAAFLLGGLWYGPFGFGKAWTAASKLKPEDMKGGAGPAYVTTFIVTLLMAYIMARLNASYMHLSGIPKGVYMGFATWAGFVVPSTLSTSLFGRRSIVQWAIEAGYYLAALVIMGLILFTWL